VSHFNENINNDNDVVDDKTGDVFTASHQKACSQIVPNLSWPHNFKSSMSQYTPCPTKLSRP